MIERFKKTQGWENRFNALVMRYYSLPFKRGESCCFIFISDCYEALCEKSPLSEWKGNVPDDRKKALALYRKHAETDSFEKAFQWLAPVKSIKHVQRGDLGIWINEEEIEILGVVAMNGRDFLFRPEDRDHLVAVKINQNMRFWRAE